MKIFRSVGILGISALLAAPLMAQQNCTPMTNNQARQQAQANARQQHRADKAQAKADKAQAKALNSRKAKKAAKEQDKANATPPPQE